MEENPAAAPVSCTRTGLYCC